MKRKVALISLCKGQEVNSVPPLALLYLATALKKNGHESKIIHKSVKDSEVALREAMVFGPDLVGMTVFTGYNNQAYVELSGQLKRQGCRIVWGNAHPTLLPEQALNESSIDFVIFGEGEETLVELVEKLNEPDKYPEIKSLAFRDAGGNIKINEKREFIKDIDEYLIDWSLIDLESYLRPYFSGRFKRVLVITTSRGCPYNCQFCYNLVFNQRRWRAHSVEGLVNNLKPLLEKYKIDGLRILDDNFFVNKERAFKIVRALGLPYLAEARTEYVDEEFVKNLKETRCQEIMFGFESGSDRIMKKVVQKGTGTKEVVNTVRLLKNSGIMVSGSIVFGFPSETRGEYLKTMQFIVNLLKLNPNLAFTCGWFLPFPGTGLYEDALKRGFKPPKRIGEWDKLDRWKNDYTMDWLDWDYTRAVKYSRDVVYLLAMTYKRNIPVFRQLLTWRVKTANYALPIDIYILSFLKRLYFSKSQNILGRFFGGAIKKLVKLNNQAIKHGGAS